MALAAHTRPEDSDGPGTLLAKITATSREAAVLKIEQDWGKGLPARELR
jgi:hypothetical protein